METFILYLCGWIILSLGVFIYKNYTDENHLTAKKLYAWRAFWAGIFSWFGIIFIFTYLIVSVIITFNYWVEDKLS